MKRKAPPKIGVTSRDGCIMRQALAYAIVAIDLLPDDRQELSNRNDMMAILEHNSDERNVEFYLLNARSHIEGRAFELVDGELQLGESHWRGNTQSQS